MPCCCARHENQKKKPSGKIWNMFSHIMHSNAFRRLKAGTSLAFYSSSGLFLHQPKKKNWKQTKFQSVGRKANFILSSYFLSYFIKYKLLYTVQHYELHILILLYLPYTLQEGGSTLTVLLPPTLLHAIFK